LSATARVAHGAIGSGTSSTMRNRDAKFDYGSSTMIEAMFGEPAAS
jgi:hypothetical protein